jgi:cbb3-type cytochrome oxidase subunit 1
MFGVFGFWIFGHMSYLWPKMYKRPMPWALSSWAFWLCSIGTIFMWVDLVAAGLVQGFLWQNPQVPWIESVLASRPFWAARTLSGVAISIGIILFALAIYKTARGPAVAKEAALKLKTI